MTFEAAMGALDRLDRLGFESSVGGGDDDESRYVEVAAPFLRYRPRLRDALDVTFFCREAKAARAPARPSPGRAVPPEPGTGARSETHTPAAAHRHRGRVAVAGVFR